METQKNQGSPKNDSGKDAVTRNQMKPSTNSKKSPSGREDDDQQKRRGTPGKNVTGKDKR
jgi:hypothetical protein